MTYHSRWCCSCVCATPSRRLPSLHHRRRPIDPSCDHQPMVYVSSSSSSVTPSASSTQLFTAPPHPLLYHPVSLCPCRTAAHTLAPTDRTTNRCLTAVCHCLNYHPPLSLGHTYSCQVTVIYLQGPLRRLHDRYIGYMTVNHRVAPRG